MVKIRHCGRPLSNILKTFIHRKYAVDIDRIQICTKDKNRTIIRISNVTGEQA